MSTGIFLTKERWEALDDLLHKADVAACKARDLAKPDTHLEDATLETVAAVRAIIAKGYGQGEASNRDVAREDAARAARQGRTLTKAQRTRTKPLSQRVNEVFSDVVRYAEDNYDGAPMHSQSNDGPDMRDAILDAVQGECSEVLAEVIGDWYEAFDD